MREPSHHDLPKRELPLAAAFDEERVAATWQRIVHAQTQSGRRQRGLTAFVATAVATVVAVLVWGLGKAPPASPLTSRDSDTRLYSGQVIESRASELVLGDGSTVRLEDKGRLQVLANNGTQFVTLLDRGPARFHVTPGGPRRWTIETTLASVEVIGTTFRVDPSPERLVVEVERGIVIVRGDRVPGRIVRLAAGEKIEVRAEEVETSAMAETGALAPSVLEAVASAAAEPEATAEPRTATHVTTPARAPAKGPQTVVQVDVALPKEREGHTETVPPTPENVLDDAPLPIHEALGEADRLRREGRPRAAAEVLERALETNPGRAAAGLAAFTLGRIASDLLHEPERAARAFLRVIELHSPASLVEDAHARRTEALLSAGQLSEAQAAIEAYQREFPKGRHLETMRARLSAP